MQFETIYNSDKIPVLGLGTWNMGGGILPRYNRDQQTVTAIRYAIELGYTHIDAAESYGRGHTEELVGQAIKGFPRQDLFITTKVSPSHLRYKDVFTSLQNSLKRLGVEYVDLYLIHWPSNRIPLDETFRALNQLVQDGLIRHLGVSNFDLELLQKAQSLSNTPIITNQVPYSVRNRRYQKNGVLAYCQQQGILLTAYSPLKGGVLRDGSIRRVAKRLAKTPAQVALNWLIRQPNVITIPKSANHGHLRENLGSLEISLTQRDLDELT